MKEKLAINEWRILSLSERENYIYVSNSHGCFFQLKKEDKTPEITDDFEKIMNERE